MAGAAQRGAVAAGCAAVSAASAFAAFRARGRDAAGVRVALRATAYATFVPFAAAISAGPLARRVEHPATQWLERQAPALGLGAALSHGVVHAALIARLVRVHEGGGTGLSRDSLPGVPGYVALALRARGWAADRPPSRADRRAEDCVLAVFSAAIVHGYATKGRVARIYAPAAALAAGCWALRLADR
jgi:hypothetical protein